MISGRLSSSEDGTFLASEPVTGSYSIGKDCRGMATITPQGSRKCTSGSWLWTAGMKCSPLRRTGHGGQRHTAAVSFRDVSYIKGILSGLAAILLRSLCSFGQFSGRKGHRSGCAQASPVAESVFSLRFWIVGILLFGVFFAASRASKVLECCFSGFRRSRFDPRLLDWCGLRIPLSLSRHH